MGMSSLALTDHGTISGWLQFYKACSDKDIKPIFGVEAYIVEDASAIKNIEESIDSMELKKKNNLPLFDGILENIDEDIDKAKTAKTKERKSNHVILLAKNEEGYRNIMRMTTWGFQNGYYYKPRIDLKTLEQHKDGVICTSACLGGQISYNIIKGNLEKAEWFVREYKRIFGENFYIELQLHSPDEQIVANKKNLEFAKKYDIPIVVTQDIHYVEADDVELHELVIKLKNKEREASLEKIDDIPRNIDIAKEVKGTKNKRLANLKEQAMTAAATEKKGDVDSDGYFYNARDYYFKSFDELKSAWENGHSYMSEDDFNEAIENTNRIASKVEKISAYSNVAFLPKIVDADSVDSKEMFRKIVKEGAKRKLANKIKEKPELKAVYEKRLTEEMDIIFSLGFEDYFLIVWDFINWSRQNDIAVGPGRGSVGGSLVAYCADITKVDPVQHGLLFSRFINKTRSSAKYKVEFDEVKLEKKK
jgi:DNA polymerase-3 subunit alpha